MMEELQLRHWLFENLSRAVDIQWVEPGRYGSTVGAPDCNVKKDGRTVSLELKVWKRTRKGIKCEMRPVQRRWHHMTMRRRHTETKFGSLCAVLFNIYGTSEVYLLRGDRVPLRDYATNKSSGCIDGELRITRISNDNDIESLLFDEMSTFWL